MYLYLVKRVFSFDQICYLLQQFAVTLHGTIRLNVHKTNTRQAIAHMNHRHDITKMYHSNNTV